MRRKTLVGALGLGGLAAGILSWIAPLFAVEEPAAVRVIPVRHVDAGELARLLESTVRLWGVEGDAVPSIRPDAEGRRLTMRSGSERIAGELYRVALLLDRDRREIEGERAAGGRAGGTAARVQQIRPGGKFAGRRVDILEGDVPVKELLRFLADYRELPVIVEAANPAATDEAVRVIAPIRDADGAVVRALLEANGWLVEEKDLPEGKRIIRVSDRASPPREIPESRPIIRVR